MTEHEDRLRAAGAPDWYLAIPQWLRSTFLVVALWAVLVSVVWCLFQIGWALTHG